MAKPEPVAVRNAIPAPRAARSLDEMEKPRKELEKPHKVQAMSSAGMRSLRSCSRPRYRRRMAVLGVVCALSIPLALLLLPGLRPKQLMIEQLRAELARATDDNSTGLLESAAQLGDAGLPLLVECTCGQDVVKADAAASLLNDQLDLWREQRPSDLHQKMATLSRLLAEQAGQGRDETRRRASQIIARLMLWPGVASGDVSQDFLGNCERVLRSDFAFAPAAASNWETPATDSVQPQVNSDELAPVAANLTEPANSSDVADTFVSVRAAPRIDAPINASDDTPAKTVEQPAASASLRISASDPASAEATASGPTNSVAVNPAAPSGASESLSISASGDSSSQKLESGARPTEPATDASASLKISASDSAPVSDTAPSDSAAGNSKTPPDTSASLNGAGQENASVQSPVEPAPLAGTDAAEPVSMKIGSRTETPAEANGTAAAPSQDSSDGSASASITAQDDSSASVTDSERSVAARTNDSIKPSDSISMKIESTDEESQGTSLADSPPGGESSAAGSLQDTASLQDSGRWGTSGSMSIGDQTTKPPGLAELADRQVMQLLVDEDKQKADDAARELQRRGYRDAHLGLARMLVGPDVDSRLALIEALPRARGIDPNPWLLWLSRDVDPRVRKAAMAVMATSSDPRLIAQLKAREKDETNPDVLQFLRGLLQGRP